AIRPFRASPMSDAAIIVLSVAGISIALAVLTIVLTLRSDFQAWMRRVLRIGPIELGPPPGQQQQAAAAAERAQPQLPLPAPIPRMPGLEPWQEVIELRIDQQNLRNSPQLVDQLKFALAQNIRLNDFHVAARYIWGTQIAALNHLNAAPNGLTIADLQPLF